MKNDSLLKKYAEALPRKDHPYAAVAEAFIRWLSGKQPEMTDVHAWIKHRKAAGYRSGTLRKEWGILQRLYTVNGIPWEAKRGEAPIINEDDLWHPRLDPEDIRAMIQAARACTRPLGPIHQSFLCLSTIWGLRREEMVRMVPEYLDMKSELVYVETAKHGRARWHYVPPELMPYLSNWGFAESVTPFQVSRIFSQLKNSIGLKTDKDLGWHSIRRELAEQFLANGIDPATAKRFLRWKIEGKEMVIRYATAPMIGRRGQSRVMAIDEKNADLKVLERHPFLECWR